MRLGSTREVHIQDLATSRRISPAVWGGSIVTFVDDDFDVATEALGQWAHHFNHERFSIALTARTPMEKLAAIRGQPVPSFRLHTDGWLVSEPPHQQRGARSERIGNSSSNERGARS